MRVIDLTEMFGRFTDAWKPKIVGDINDMHVKVVTLRGEFVWHHHDAEDELFLVVAGRLRMQLRDGDRDASEPWKSRSGCSVSGRAGRRASGDPTTPGGWGGSGARRAWAPAARRGRAPRVTQRSRPECAGTSRQSRRLWR